METAQTSLNAERQTSKALLLTEEEIKSLQLQVKLNIILGTFRRTFDVLVNQTSKGGNNCISRCIFPQL